MARNTVPLSQVIKDFIITLDGDDYASNASDSAIRHFALRGIREIGFDLSKKVKSLKLNINMDSWVRGSCFISHILYHYLRIT